MNKDRLYIDHILEAISIIGEHITDLEYKDFQASRLIQDAVIREIEIIGEAAKRLSEEYKSQHAGIPWKYVCGMRDKLIHDYFGVDLEAVWSTVKNDLNDLKDELSK